MKSIEKVKDYLKEKNTVITYFEIGRLLNEAGGKYGDNFIDKYSKKLVIKVGKKYNRRTLFRMKQFYNVFSNEKVSPLVTQLTWTNCLVLLSIKDVNELYYYANEVKNRLLSKRQLEEIIKNKNTKDCQSQLKNKLIFEEKLEVKDLVPNPILIKNKRNIETATKRTLHDLILVDIEFFMKELGNNFSFIGSEYKIKIGDTYHKIDLLLFNINYNAYVVVELKVTQF